MPEHAVFPISPAKGHHVPSNLGMSPSKVPFLPGNAFADVSKSDHRKSHLLDTRNGYRVPRELLSSHAELPTTQEELEKMIEDATRRNADLTYGGKLSLARPAAQPAFVPPFVAYDKVVLRFKAYFKQTVHDSTEQFLLRVVLILYYLEDDSIAVVEPPQANSGILQGVLIKRQRLPKTSTEVYTVRDLNNGANVTFYGKTFHIVDMDEFTRRYLTENLNVKVNPTEEVPTDKYLASRTRPTPQRGDSAQPDKLYKFLKHDRHVLRFYCQWRDPAYAGGEAAAPSSGGIGGGSASSAPREFVLHFYLVDDCVEIKEVHRPNDGRDPSPLLLKRMRLPKAFHGLDALAGEGRYYTWQELRTGSVINVLNRRFIIHDCDEFTRRFYTDNLGVAMAPLDLREPAPQAAQRTYPPYNGFGSEEDSLQSCLHLVLQPPKKIMPVTDDPEQQPRVLRFVAKMESRHREDAGRRFVISVYTPGGEVSIYEPPIRNNGTLGGKFLEKTKVLAPGASMQAPKYYSPRDFAVGAAVTINAHTFRLLDADEAVYKFQERRPNEFKFASADHVVAKVRASGREAVLRAALSPRPGSATSAATGKNQGVITLDALRSALAECGLIEHEVRTLHRNVERVLQLLEA